MSVRQNKWLPGGLLLAAVTLALYYRDHFQFEIIENWVTSAGIAAPLIFVMVYALAAVLLLPGSIFTLTGGEAVVQKALIAIALIASTAFLPRLVKRLRRTSTTVSE